jgi:hypothetical protein
VRSLSSTCLLEQRFGELFRNDVDSKKRKSELDMLLLDLEFIGPWIGWTVTYGVRTVTVPKGRCSDQFRLGLDG